MMNDVNSSDEALPSIAEMAFEQAQAELESIVERLEDPHTDLEQAIALWERGEALHAHCQSKLDYAATKIEQLTVSQADAAEAVPPSDDFVPEPSESVDDQPPAPVAAEPEPSLDDGTLRML